MARLFSLSLVVGIGAAACLAPILMSPAAAEPGTALACAKADLALMYKLADEHGTSAAPPNRLAQAAMQMLEARAACRVGDHARGLALYTDADALADGHSSAALTERR